jgi:hypothetical protein
MSWPMAGGGTQSPVDIVAQFLGWMVSCLRERRMTTPNEVSLARGRVLAGPKTSRRSVGAGAEPDIDDDVPAAVEVGQGFRR